MNRDVIIFKYSTLKVKVALQKVATLIKIGGEKDMTLEESLFNLNEDELFGKVETIEVGVAT